MEHISVTLTQGQGADPSLSASRVVAAVNEAIGGLGFKSTEAQATVYQAGLVTVRVSHGAISALINQELPMVIEGVNKTLKRRYGGPVVERIEFRTR